MSYSYRAGSAPAVTRRRSFKRTGFGAKRSRGKAEQVIDPRRFIKAATITETAPYEPMHTFDDFALNGLLKANLAAKGYVIPSPIQDQAIPVALTGRDVIGMASTGTGKTAAFALPMLQRLIDDPSAAALIIAPTRELAQQIEQECRALGKGSRLLGALLIGGVGMGGQLQDLRHNPRIVIGTPGRMKDHIQRGSLKLQRFNVVVLDEVDRMLDMGFVKDVTFILSHASQQRQSLFFSATMDAQVRTLIETFTKDPVTISLRPSTTSENVHQDVVYYHDRDEKLDKLCQVLQKEEVAKAIVFDETKYGVERLSKKLLARGFSVAAIHGGKTQGQRQRALDQFKKHQINILVATDVAARGIDVTDITHVINFSVPKVYDDYIHRIGRAGRAGKVGHALTFVEAKTQHAVPR